MLPIEFDPYIAQTKPRSARKDPCPFCQPDQLTGILDTRDDMIWLLNKYPVMRRTWQTVLIETAQHDADITTYSRDRWRRILEFAFEKWQQTVADPRFASVILYRNFGPLSGGSIRHPHSQIIGLYDHDYCRDITLENLDGDLIYENTDVRCTLSDEPLGSIRELNITLLNPNGTDAFADAIRDLVRWTCDPKGWDFNSYNLFFYHFGTTHCKIVPRDITSPFFHGYRLAQTFIPEKRLQIVKAIRQYIESSRQ